MRQEKLLSGDDPMACNYKHTMYVCVLFTFVLASLFVFRFVSRSFLSNSRQHAQC